MELFDKKFVYFMWDDALLDKQVFVADYLSTLKGNVNAGNYDRVKVKESDRADFPFQIWDTNDEEYLEFMFAYCDPLYDCKVAYSKGASIECRCKGSTTRWLPIPHPSWDERYEYRVKPKEIVATNKQVAEWLSKSNGQIRLECTISTDYEYSLSMDNATCGYKVRRWEDIEWHDATHEYLGIKDN